MQSQNNLVVTIQRLFADHTALMQHIFDQQKEQRETDRQQHEMHCERLVSLFKNISLHPAVEAIGPPKAIEQIDAFAPKEAAPKAKHESSTAQIIDLEEEMPKQPQSTDIIPNVPPEKFRFGHLNLEYMPKTIETAHEVTEVPKPAEQSSIFPNEVGAKLDESPKEEAPKMPEKPPSTGRAPEFNTVMPGMKSPRTVYTPPPISSKYAQRFQFGMIPETVEPTRVPYTINFGTSIQVEAEKKPEEFPMPFSKSAISLPPRTGEEVEAVEFVNRCKLYRFDRKDKENKEKGTGEIKLLHNKATGRYRCVMRCEPAMNLCANFPIYEGFTLSEKPGLPTAFTWMCKDYSMDANGVDEMYTVRFREEKTAKEFFLKVNQAAGAKANK